MRRVDSGVKFVSGTDFGLKYIKKKRSTNSRLNCHRSPSRQLQETDFQAPDICLQSEVKKRRESTESGLNLRPRTKRGHKKTMDAAALKDEAATRWQDVVSTTMKLGDKKKTHLVQRMLLHLQLFKADRDSSVLMWHNYPQTKARWTELNLWGELKSHRDVFLSNTSLSVAQSSWIQLWRGVSTDCHRSNVSLSHSSDCFVIHPLTAPLTGHTRVTVQTRAISTSLQDAAAVTWLWSMTK